MGFRIRKSFGGKNFRVNISKSGVGYSYGVNGFRKTKMANGRNRTTISLKGTGFSYVSESSKAIKSSNQTRNNQSITSMQEKMENDIDNVNEILFEESNEEEFVNAVQKAKKMYNLAILLIIIGCFCIFGGGFIVCSFVLIPLGIYLMYNFKKNLKVNVEYEFDENENEYSEYKEVWLKLNKNQKLWEIITSTTNTDTRYTSGASRSVGRQIVRFTEKVFPYLAVDNQKILSLKLRKKEILFLPDKLLIIQGSQIALVNYPEMSIKLSEKRFAEDECVASDSKVVDHTWQYVNKNGTPDKRFANNRQIPVCLYGTIEISDLRNNFCVELQMSSYDIYTEIKDKIKKSIKK